ncbi:MAG: UDP-glucose/GDP-mannose dehydrogenase family protein [Alicyclobacillus macrosporangiidus]|uniref:UDP-glucose dehydrogenase family protein n=1 Tax=Alicyclobacillus macrosporangiidus TaxID=392015 RepID=UPI0026EC3FB3|nr:UDP-glucose/GDP-mannose dehydrogenase family protein [Alicyclobacillus macrosporangiidus]MCL6597580.1 UDP-glucose/GDP-mannose dehydrogenase family protein [Alicyclobacillus macrosporangiidus]
MNIAVVGLGYVGVCTAASFAAWGHQVFGVDVDERKIRLLREAVPPFYEVGLDAALQRLTATGRLRFTTSLADTVAASDVVFITVGTPSDVDGRADVSSVLAVARQIGEVMEDYRLVVVKSTVPVGTTDTVRRIIGAALRERGRTIAFDVAANPEFLREGSALKDALNPDRIVVGTDAERAATALRQLYAAAERPVFVTTVRNAEMIKYASNAFLAAKISFVNELARLCEHTGADVVEVSRGMGMDARIGPYFLQAGIGYGGSCFPKDVRALIRLGQEHGLVLDLLQKVEQVNQTQVEWCMSKLAGRLGGLSGRRIALLGLTFKPHTDDIREAPSLRVIQMLLQEGALVSAFDPKGATHVQSLYPALRCAATPYEAAAGADAVLLLTEWPQIVGLNWQALRQVVQGNVLLDARNALQPAEMRRAGFQYMGVGRGVAEDGGDGP